jgi:hypothetical protein
MSPAWLAVTEHVPVLITDTVALVVPEEKVGEATVHTDVELLTKVF